MKTYYRIISFMFALLAAITTINASYYRDKAYAVRDWGYKQKDTVFRAARNNPGRTAAIGVAAGATIGYMARNTKVGVFVRGRMRQVGNLIGETYYYGSKYYRSPTQRKAWSKKIEDEKIENEKIEQEKERLKEKRLKASRKELKKAQALREKARRKTISEKSQRFGPETQVSAKELEEIRKKREKKLKQSETDSDEEEAGKDAPEELIVQ